jgi:hypothetical protein
MMNTAHQMAVSGAGSLNLCSAARRKRNFITCRV